MWRSLQRWRGVVLVAAAVLATAILWFNNQLVLYIHPRYIVFTVVMSGLALVFVLASLLLRPAHDEQEHEDAQLAPRRGSHALSLAAVVVAGLLAAAMILLPPATLSSTTATQRDITSTTVGAQTQSVSEADAAPVASFAAFTVVDWASLLRQTSDLGFYAGKPVDVVGFVTADADDPQNVFYVSRFVVTCCAVDAQPTGIPVYLANWPDTLKADDWVRVTGEFAANPSARSTQGVALKPNEVTAVEQPSEPYLY